MRFRFSLMVLLAFGTSYGASWLAIREKYRVSPPPGQQGTPAQGEPVDRLRVLLEKETDLVGGTAAIAALIAQLSEADCLAFERDIFRTSSANAPIIHQCIALLRYQFAKQRAPGATGDDESQPRFGAALWQAFARGQAFMDSVSQSAGGEPPISPDSGNDAVLYSPMQWALTWLDRHDRAKASSIIRELGSQWQASVKTWLFDLIWTDGPPGSNRFIDALGADDRASYTDEILDRWLRFDSSGLFRWALLQPQERLPMFFDRLLISPGLIQLWDDDADFLIAALDSGLLSEKDWYKKAFTAVLDRTPAKLASHLSRRKRDNQFAILCGEICRHPTDGRAERLLEICDTIGDPKFKEAVQREIIQMRQKNERK